MAGMGALPKAGSTRTEQRKKTLGRVLNQRLETIPKLPVHPDGAWHKMTREWWKDVWASPMAPEFDNSDKHGLFLLALLVDNFWCAESAAARIALSSEIRLQSVRFGLSPIDRFRLQWQIEATGEAQDKGKRRRNATAATTGAAPVVAQESGASERRVDPRSGLYSVQ